MTGSSFGDESVRFRELEQLAAAGRHREVLDGLERLPAQLREGRTRPALLAAEAYGRLGEHEAAVRWADTARTLARARGEAYAELRARNYQGLIALRHGDVAQAEQHLAEALDMARALNDRATEARCLNNLGVLANIRGAPDAALSSYRLALVAYQAIGHSRGLAETYHNIGISLRDEESLQPALEAAEEAVRLATQAGDEQMIALATTGRAELRLALGDPTLAAAELMRAAERYNRIGFRAGLPEVWRVQAAVARATGNLVEAVALLDKAAQLARDLGSTDTLADIERDLSITLSASGDRAAAKAALERAVSLYMKIGATHAANRLISNQDRP